MHTIGVFVVFCSFFLLFGWGLEWNGMGLMEFEFAILGGWNGMGWDKLT